LKIINEGQNSIEEADDIYFPTVKELVSSFRKYGLPEQGLSKKPMPQTVDEPAVEKRGNMDGSQGGRTQSSSS
jgi:hypothetical protein